MVNGARRKNERDNWRRLGNSLELGVFSCDSEDKKFISSRSEFLGSFSALERAGLGELCSSCLSVENIVPLT